MEKILVIRFSSLGDVILTTPATRALKEKFPGAELHVLTKRAFSGIFEGSPFVDKVIEFDDKKCSSIFRLLKFIKALNINRYSIVVDLHRNLRSRMIYTLLCASRKVSYKKGAIKRRLLVAYKMRFKNMPHTVDKYLSALKPLGVASAAREPFMMLSRNNEEFAEKFFSANNIHADSIKIAVCPGAKNYAKIYPREKFVNLIDMITGRLGARVILIGAPDERQLIDSIILNVKDKDKVASLTNASIAESAAVIKSCNQLITNDSGPMHIASAVGTPIIALFGPTDKDFGFYPLGKNNIVLTKGYDCSPCSLHGKKECIKFKYRCLNDISESEILSHIINEKMA